MAVYFLSAGVWFNLYHNASLGHVRCMYTKTNYSVEKTPQIRMSTNQY